jgi:predicted metal-binding membrane protein
VRRNGSGRANEPKPTIGIAALTIFVLLEKIAPLGAQGGQLSGWLIIALGLFNLAQNFRH